MRDRLVGGVVGGVVQVGLGQGHEQAIDPVDPLCRGSRGCAAPRARTAAARPPLPGPVVSAKAGTMIVSSSRLTSWSPPREMPSWCSTWPRIVVVDLRLEVVAGDHQVGGAAADVDAGDADFVGRVAEGLRLGRLPAPGAAGPRGAGPGAWPRRGGRPARPRHVRHVLRPWASCGRGPGAAGEPQPRVLAQHPHLAPDVGQVARRWPRRCSGSAPACTRWLLPRVLAKILIALLPWALQRVAAPPGSCRWDS